MKLDQTFSFIFTRIFFFLKIMVKLMQPDKKVQFPFRNAFFFQALPPSHYAANPITGESAVKMITSIEICFMLPMVGEISEGYANVFTDRQPSISKEAIFFKVMPDPTFSQSGHTKTSFH